MSPAATPEPLGRIWLVRWREEGRRFVNQIPVCDGANNAKPGCPVAGAASGMRRKAMAGSSADAAKERRTMTAAAPKPRRTDARTGLEPRTRPMMTNVSFPRHEKAANSGQDREPNALDRNQPQHQRLPLAGRATRAPDSDAIMQWHVAPAGPMLVTGKEVRLEWAGEQRGVWPFQGGPLANIPDHGGVCGFI